MGIGTLRRHHSSAPSDAPAPPEGGQNDAAGEAPQSAEPGQTDLNALKRKNAPKAGPGIAKGAKTPSKPL